MDTGILKDALVDRIEVVQSVLEAAKPVQIFGWNAEPVIRQFIKAINGLNDLIMASMISSVKGILSHEKRL